MRSPRGLGGTMTGVAALALSLSACGSGAASSAASTRLPAEQESAGVRVVAATNVYGDIVRQIAGDKVSITSIISDPAQDPHSYEANAATQLALSKADIVIENGGGYDDFVDSMLKTSGNATVKLINVVNISGKTAPAGSELNEHVWYDFPTVEKLSDVIAAALGTADPANAATFTANATSFKQKIDALERQEAEIKAAHAGAGAAITEPVPLYLLDASGLVNKTPAEFSEAVEEGTDVPAAVLNQTLGLFRTGAVKVLAYNEQTVGLETEKVLAAAKSGNVAVMPVTETLPNGKDYVSWMTANLQALRAALG
jgi:zinc/manganese transport system substrate-binding protein